MKCWQLGSVPPAGERKIEGDVMAVNHKGTVGVPSLVARLLTAHHTPLIVATSGAQVYALSPKCPHLGLPMKTGDTSAGFPRSALLRVILFISSLAQFRTW